jgi:copper(I)-binding protein
MMKIPRTDIYPTPAAIVAFFLAELLAFPTMATDYDVGSIHIAQPWSRATPKGAKTGAGYMTITNKGTTPRQSQLRFG